MKQNSQPAEGATVPNNKEQRDLTQLSYRAYAPQTVQQSNDHSANLKRPLE